MDKITSERGDRFKRILIVEYETLLREAVESIIRYKRLLKDYNFTPTQLQEEEWAAKQQAKNVIHYRKILKQLKGAENGAIPTETERTVAETPQMREITCTTVF